MMHNGILHTGNAADTSKSDTWHFIRDYLSSPVAEYPALVHNEKFLDMIAEFIGDNRFVFMDGDGKMSHVNYDQGVEHDGLWFSNTYAWRPSRLIPSYQYSTKYPSRHYDWLDDDKYDNAYGGYRSLPSGAWSDEDDEAQTAKYNRRLSAHDPAWDEDDYDFPETAAGDLVLTAQAVLDALMAADVDLMTIALEDAPETTINILCNVLACQPTAWVRVEEMSTLELRIYQDFLACDVESLTDKVLEDLHGNVADVACYYLNWSHKVAIA